MDTIQSQVDELISQMTPAEKAGQLTQYFYFRLPAGAEPAESRLRRRRAAADGRVGSAGGRVRVRCCSSPIRPRSTACNGSRSRATASASRCCSVSTSSTGCARSFPVPIAMAASWDPDDDRARPGGRRPRGARRGHPLDVRADGRHRPRSALGSDHRGRRRGPVPRRRRGRRPGARLPGRRAGCARPHHRRSEALRRVRRRARWTRLRRGQPLRLRALERVLPAVRGGGRGRAPAT